MATQNRLYRAMRLALGLVLTMAVGIGGFSSAQAQSYAERVLKANDRRVGIISSAPGETGIDIANDLSTVLHCVNGLRVLPMVGRGDAQNLQDLLFLRGVDMAIIRADALDELGNQKIVPDIKNRVAYIAPLFVQEIHLIAGQDVRSISDLRGKFVNIGGPGDMAIAVKRILKANGLEVIESKFDSALALERVIDGQLDAMFVTGGKPIGLLQRAGAINGLKLLSIPAIPEHPVYKKVTITHEDYPNLVPAGSTVETLGIPSVLTVYNWAADNPRYPQNKLFTDAFFDRLSYLNRPARHPKWASVDPYDDVPGWTRFAAAAERVALKRGGATAQASAPAAPAASSAATGAQSLEARFEAQLKQYGIVPRNAEERAQLFEAFKRRSGGN